MPLGGPLPVLRSFVAFFLIIEAKQLLLETENGSELLTEEQTNVILGALPHQLREEYESLDKATQQKLQKKLYTMLGEPDWARPLSKADFDELTKRMEEMAKYGSISNLLNDEISPDGLAEGQHPECFSGASTVQTKRGVLSIKELVLGDSVLTFSHGKGLIYTEFLGWLHREANVYANFLKISTNSSSIVLTGNHLIFRTSVADGALESVFADQIEEGDKLVSWKGSKMTEEAVVAVEPTREKGFWTPLTMEGTLLVDGLLASCYAYFSQTLSDLVLVPFKMFPRMLLDDQKSLMVDGMRNAELVDFVFKIGTAMGLCRPREEAQTGERADLEKGEKLNPGNAQLALAAAGSSKHIEL